MWANSIPMPDWVCAIFYFKIMAKIKKLEFFKGELNGFYQKLWVAISENGNVFKTSELEYDNGIPDIESTRWTHISNENYTQITDGMSMFKAMDYSVGKKSKSRGLGM